MIRNDEADGQQSDRAREINLLPYPDVVAARRGRSSPGRQSSPCRFDRTPNGSRSENAARSELFSWLALPFSVSSEPTIGSRSETWRLRAIGVEIEWTTLAVALTVQ